MNRTLGTLTLLSFTLILSAPSASAMTRHGEQDGSGLFTFTDLQVGLDGFAMQVTIPTPSSLIWGDYDNDGKLDILLAGISSIGAIAQIHRNNGTGTFNDIGAGLPDLHDCSVAWGDYDNDGDLDILLAGGTGTGFIARIYRNDAGSFTDIAAGLPGLYDCSAAWGDYDNDGDLDLLLTGFTTGGTGYLSEVYRNDAGTFTSIGAGLPGVSFSSVAWGDYDNDGDLDILLTGDTGSGYIARVYRNDGGGTFADASAALPGVAHSSVAWGDFDDDGDLDILLAGDTSSTYISLVCRNLGGGVFAPAAYLTGVSQGSVAWGDYDNDGDLDILLAGDTGSGYVSLVYRNNGDGTFTDIGAGLPGVIDASVAWGDSDNDGDLDILLMGYTGSAYLSGVFSSSGSVANAPPSPPSNLAAIVVGSEVTLSWDPASDDTTPAAGLSYNLRVGTTPGGGEVLSGMADAATGYRSVVQLGNTNQRTSWTLDLPAGPDYYWSVQAIDAGFAASQWAMEIATGVDDGAPTPRAFALHAAVPNPFNPRTTIRYDLPRDSRVHLSVYDVSGRLVRTLVEGVEVAAGQREAVWDGRDEVGRSASSGVYFCRLETDDYHTAIRMTLLK